MRFNTAVPRLGKKRRYTAAMKLVIVLSWAGKIRALNFLFAAVGARFNRGNLRDLCRARFITIVSQRSSSAGNGGVSFPETHVSRVRFESRAVYISRAVLDLEQTRARRKSRGRRREKEGEKV